MASIKFLRTEYVREYYELEWNEKNYAELLKYLSEREDGDSKIRYEALKDIPFDRIVAIFNDEADDIRWNFTRTIGDNSWTYSESAYDYIRDMMREDAFNMGAMDFDCYDSDEEFETYS